jgi:AraC family ethanolamine operon transcriptional activator
MAAADRVIEGGAGSNVGWSLETAELDEVAERIQGWRAHLTRLAPGPFWARVEERLLPSLRIVRLGFRGAAAISSHPVEGADPFQVGLMSAGRTAPVWDGRSVRPGVLMVKSGSYGSNVALPGGCEFTTVRMDRRRVATLVRVFAGEERPLSVGLVRLPPADLGALRARVDTLARGGPEERGAVEEAERDVYERVARALAGPGDPSPPASEARRRALRRVEEYMRAHEGDRLSLADLCVAAECSERTLRYVFHERYGLSPAAFLKRMRLQGLRRDLQESTPRSATVVDLALRWGFGHQGHLARDYRAFFGETPAATLARSGSLHRGGP